ncbi:MAG TPA: hypothetical protein VFY48_02740 [Solirubrobacterales bacterium]|nr:hypothetical protein [Solirubrobacterales bacterium]
MTSSATAKWIGLALLGLAIAAVVAIAASNLVSRQIGIASESVSAGDSLAPAVESAARQRGDRGDGTGNAPAATGAADGSESGGGESADEVEDRLDAQEDAREDREKAAEDALDEREDAREDASKDNSGSGSDD